VSKKVIPFPGSHKAAPPPGSGPAAKTPPEDGAVMAVFRERRDRAMARKLTVQNRVIKGELIPRDTVKGTMGRISAAWRSVIPEHSYSTSPIILAVLKIKDPAADSRLRLLLDDAAYSTGGRINKAMEKWLQFRETDDAK
jgi:hypothetical protein